ncbi:MAG: hypothetical protein JW816_03860 [Candidatus Buchananbacteria bacterium]|nr:hypothetical protein [Candidatus Buchananbacteria bacterium]
MASSKKTAKILGYIAKIILLIVALFWFGFALLSGAEDYGGGLKGIIMNSPNALPWLLLLVFVYVAWRWELVGGIIVAILGILTIFAFDAFEQLGVLLTITIPLIILGGLLIISWRCKKQ